MEVSPYSRPPLDAPLNFRITPEKNPAHGGITVTCVFQPNDSPHTHVQLEIPPQKAGVFTLHSGENGRQRLIVVSRRWVP